MDYQELIERLRNSCEDAIQPDDVYEAADLIEQLQAENERLNAELAKYRDAPVVAYRHLMEDGWEYFDAPTSNDCPKCVPLIVKPGENNDLLP